jgi:hypothetical protein
MPLPYFLKQRDAGRYTSETVQLGSLWIGGFEAAYDLLTQPNDRILRADNPLTKLE